MQAYSQDISENRIAMLLIEEETATLTVWSKSNPSEVNREELDKNEALNHCYELQDLVDSFGL